MSVGSDPLFFLWALAVARHNVRVTSAEPGLGGHREASSSPAGEINLTLAGSCFTRRLVTTARFFFFVKRPTVINDMSQQLPVCLAQ